MTTTKAAKARRTVSRFSLYRLRGFEPLQTLPDRVTGLESQILQLRGELRDEFSAIRERDEETRRYARTLQQEVLTRLQEGLQEALSRSGARGARGAIGAEGATCGCSAL